MDERQAIINCTSLPAHYITRHLNCGYTVSVSKPDILRLAANTLAFLKKKPGNR